MKAWVPFTTLIAFSGLMLFSCTRPSSEAPKVALIQERRDLQPEAQPDSKAKLALAGVEIPVEVKRRIAADRVTIELWSHEQLFEEEVYQNLPEAFLLVSPAGEHYEPPIPLLKFPLRLDDKWTWSGQMLIGELRRSCKAEVSVRQDELYVGKEDVKTIRTEVELQIENGGSVPAKRRLTFWFAPGKGVIKREFGAAATREPLTE